MDLEDSNSSPFSCACEESLRSACSKLDAYNTQDGNNYCVLHYPGPKGPEFWSAIQHKLENKDFDFGGVWFPQGRTEFFFAAPFTAEARFNKAVFEGPAVFTEAKFCSEGATFADAVFKSQADFSNASFQGIADFSSAEFNESVHFYSTRFLGDVLFTFANFSGEADFQKAFFDSLVSLDFVNAKDYVLFGSKRDDERLQGFSSRASLSMEGARIDKPEYVSFHTLALRPHWFTNADPRNFTFTQIEWIGLSEKRFRFNIEEEVSMFEGVGSAHRLLSITYQQLARNAEENHRYKEASLLRYWSMDVRRRERSTLRSVLTLDWWYWCASGYGERVGQALVVLVFLWFCFGFAYLFVGFGKTVARTLPDGRVLEEVTSQQLKPFVPAFLYSAEIITLQKPDPKPITPMARILVTLETVLGLTQIALLALAIRRKFMR